MKATQTIALALGLMFSSSALACAAKTAAANNQVKKQSASQLAANVLSSPAPMKTSSRPGTSVQ